MAFLKRIKGMTTGLFKQTEAASKDIEQAGETLKQINEMKEEFLEELGQMEKEVQDTETDEPNEDLDEALEVVEKEFEEVLEDEISEDPVKDKPDLAFTKRTNEPGGKSIVKDHNYDSLGDLYEDVDVNIENIEDDLKKAGEHTVTICIDFDDDEVDDIKAIGVPASAAVEIMKLAVRDNKTFRLRLLSEKKGNRELISINRLETPDEEIIEGSSALKEEIIALKDQWVKEGKPLFRDGGGTPLHDIVENLKIRGQEEVNINVIFPYKLQANYTLYDVRIENIEAVTKHLSETIKQTFYLSLDTSILAKDKEDKNETKDKRPIHDGPGEQGHSSDSNSDSISKGQLTEECRKQLLQYFGAKCEEALELDLSLDFTDNVHIGIDWGSDEDEKEEGNVASPWTPPQDDYDEDEEDNAEGEDYDDENEGEDEDYDDENEERRALDEKLSEFLKSAVEKALKEPLIKESVSYFYSVDDEDNLYEKYDVSQSGHEITIKQGGKRQPFSLDVIIAFLEDESDYFSREDSIMVVSEDYGDIDQVASLGELYEIHEGFEGLEVHLVITENGDLRAAGRISGGAYKYIFNKDGELNHWMTDRMSETKERDNFYICLAHEMQARIEEEIPELDEFYFREIKSYGRPMANFLRKVDEIEVSQIKESQANQRRANEKITVGSSMSEKNLDSINKAKIYPEISSGKRMFIESKTRYNKFIAYVDENEPRTPRGGLKISFGEELEEDNYDDFQIRIEKLFPRQETLTIKDTQIIKDLTEYLQLTDDNEFVIDLMTFINRQDDTILSGVRQQLILVPDMAKYNVVLAYNDIRGDTSLRNLSVKDTKKIAGGEYGMSAYIDLDMLGGYIYGKRN